MFSVTYKELLPLETQKPFNNKATIIEHSDRFELLSYNTIISSYEKGSGKILINGKLSATSKRHFIAWCDHFNFTTPTKNDFENGYLTK